MQWCKRIIVEHLTGRRAVPGPGLMDDEGETLLVVDEGEPL